MMLKALFVYAQTTIEGVGMNHEDKRASDIVAVLRRVCFNIHETLHLKHNRRYSSQECLCWAVNISHLPSQRLEISPPRKTLYRRLSHAGIKLYNTNNGGSICIRTRTKSPTAAIWPFMTYRNWLYSRWNVTLYIFGGIHGENKHK